MKNKYRFLSLFIVLALCLTMSISAFATDFDSVANNSTTARLVTYEVSSDGVVTSDDDNSLTRSSISGYGQKTITSGGSGIVIYPTGSGWGGMGVTIKCSSATFSGDFQVTMFDPNGNLIINNSTISSSGNNYFNNLYTTNPSFYGFSFSGIPSGGSVYVQIWIYG